MWQCEKDNFNEIISDCPVVNSTNPENLATGVPLSQIISATFNEKMDPATITQASFILQKGTTPVSGTVSYAESVASFKPSTSLTPNTVYTATVKTSVKDALGNALQTDYILTFTTNLSPGVILTDPLNNATDVDRNQVISATFSVPMNPTSLNMATFTLKNGETPIAGKIAYSGAIASFTPTSLLTPGTIYTATISTGVKSESGTSLESDYVWSFNTGGIPAIIITDPANLEEEVALDKTVTATFSEEMDPATLTTTTFTLKQGAVKIIGVVSTDGFTVSFNPDNNLLYGTTYTAIITKGAMNAKGKTLESDYVWTFTTNDLKPPTVISTDPANNVSDVELNTDVTATFSVPMDQTTLTTSSVTLKQGETVISGTVSYSGSTVTFNPDNNLSYSAVYTATIAAGVKNMEGIAMINNYTWSFTTKIATPPTVISTDPADDAIDVELNKTISATFSVPMDEGTFTASTFMVKQRGNTVNGVIAYSGSTVTFDPDDNFSYGSTYIVTITTGLKDTEGTPMAHNYVWGFTTKDAPAPTIILTDPVNNENGVELSKVITATFSVAMEESTVNSSTFTLKQGTTTVSGNVTCSGTVATFTPTDNLLSGVNYTATITTAAKNTDGTNLANSYSWSFNTVDPLGPTAIDLKTVGRFGIFAAVEIINNTGATEVRNQDVGITGLRSAIEGFSPANVINGAIYASDDGATVETMLIKAKVDLTNAYQYAERIVDPAPTILQNDIGGAVLAPGLYKSQANMVIQIGNVTLDAQGDVNAVWIFQIASGLNTLSGSGGHIILINGAQAKNVFWQVGSTASIGENTTFYGTIIAQGDITVNKGVTVNGRLLSIYNSVHVDTNIINKP